MGIFSRSRSQQVNKIPLLQYGLQRSGTNFFAELMRRNFRGVYFINGEDRNTIIHKHFRLYDDKSRIPEPQFQNEMYFPHFSDFLNALPDTNRPEWTFIISKEPFSWLKSYRRWAIKNAWPEPAYDYIEEYVLFYGKWMQFALENNNIMFIRYEKLLADPGSVLSFIAEKTGLVREQHLDIPDKVYASRRFSRKKKKEILQAAYLEAFSESEIEKYKHMLRGELLPFMGYVLPG